MEISTNSSIYNAITSLQTNSATKTKSVSDLSSETDSFTIAKNEKTQASDYTYDEYKKLSIKDINEIFPWDKMPHENEKAQKLQLIATLSPDETLNQVLFDQAKNADFNDISTRNFFDRTLRTAETENALISAYKYDTSEEGIKAKEEYYKNVPYKDKLALAKEFGFSSVEEKDAYDEAHKTNHYADPLDKEIDGVVDAKTYFGFYEMGKNYFKEYGKDLSDYSRRYLPGEYALFDQVKSEYERRVSQNDNVLNQLTKNTKPNPLEINI
jgi:hypothetical protein